MDSTATPTSPQLAELRQRVRALQRNHVFIWSQVGELVTGLLNQLTDTEARADRQSAHITTLTSMANAAAKHIAALQEQQAAIADQVIELQEYRRRVQAVAAREGVVM